MANIEGNRFTADQLGDLVQTVLTRNNGEEHLTRNQNVQSPAR